MWIIYSISMLILYILFLRIHKTDKSQNLLFWLSITVIIAFCYNTFICYLYSTLHIPCNLTTLSICNIIMIIGIGVFLHLHPKKQNYYIRKKDLIFCLVVLFVVIAIAKAHFGGFPFELNYDSTDAATHFITAKEFCHNESLLNRVENTTIFDLKLYMPISYVNTGIAFFIGSNFLEEYQLYNIYVLMDLFILFISGISIYSLLTRNAEEKGMNILAGIFAILYLLAYQLDSMIFGFAYLSLGLLIIIAITMMIKLREKSFNKIIWLISMFLLNFGLFFGYYLFVPVVFLAEGIYILLEMIKNKKQIKVFSKENILEILIILGLPSLMGLIYFIIPTLGKINSTIALEGHIYRELYANFLFLLPFTIFYIFSKIKQKKNDFITITLLVGGAITFLLFLVGVFTGKVSSYYYFKMYYMLYIFFIIATFGTIKELYQEKTKIFMQIIIGIYIFCIIFSLFNIDKKIADKSINFNQNPRMESFVSIYSDNFSKMNPEKKICTQDMLDIIYYYAENIKEDKNSVMVKGNNRLQRWMYALFGVTHHPDYLSFSEPSVWNTTEDWLKTDKKYLIAFYEEKLNLDNQDKYEVLLLNNDGCILRRKN